MTFTAPKTAALIVVDVQNDFCPGGNLAVNDGDQIVTLINEMRGNFETRVYTRDWHPEDHKSFAGNHAGKQPFETIPMPYGVQVLWPDHCVQGTDGAEFHPALRHDGADLILEKGTNPGIDSYSGFYENDRKTQPRFANGKTLTETLKARGVTHVVLCGLAYDFCVGWHALDARKEGFDVIVIKDAARSIAMPLPDGGTTETAMDAQLAAAGVKLVNTADLARLFPANAISQFGRPHTVKLAAAQINTRTCDIRGNVRKIEKFWDEAEAKGVDLMVTPEQSIAGYPLEDMAANPDILSASQTALDYLTEKSKSRKTALIVGLPERGEKGAVYNVVYLIDNGRRAGPIRKQHLPNDDVFDEKRIYTSGPRTEPVEFRGRRLGIAICEDVWHPDVIADLTAKGAEVIIAPNASPYYVGKQNVRLNDVMRQRLVTEGNALPMLYVNQVGGQDEILFDGYSTAMNADGAVMMTAPSFVESLNVVDLRFQVKGPARFKKSSVFPMEAPLEETWNALVLSIRDYIEKSGIRNKQALLGMSGGIDSAVVAALAVDALGPDNVSLYKLPSQFSSESSLTDSDEAAQLLGCGIDEINIEPMVEAVRQSLKPLFKASTSPAALSLTDENIQPRIRGLALMGLSNANGGILLSTGNKSEVSVGYCTLYGDMNGGFNPLKDVLKMKVYALAEWRNNHPCRIGLGPKTGSVIPQNIIDKKPSAELRPGQVDQDSLPPYPVLDDILERYIEREQAVGAIIADTGYAPDLVTDVIRKADLAEHKRRQACPGPKISRRSFGKGRRVPISQPGIVATICAIEDLGL